MVTQYDTIRYTVVVSHCMVRQDEKRKLTYESDVVLQSDNSDVVHKRRGIEPRMHSRGVNVVVCVCRSCLDTTERNNAQSRHTPARNVIVLTTNIN